MKKYKGFTLVECIIAMAILGIASLLLVQGYSQLMSITKKNTLMNVSITKQMADAEAQGGAVNKISSGQTMKIKSSVTGRPQCSSDGTFSCKVDVYAVSGRDYQGNAFVYNNDSAFATNGKDGTDMRYVYFHS